jgi:hypothetical protein
MPETYPVGLPGVHRDNYQSGSSATNVRRTQMASGRIRQVRRFTLDTRVQGVQWKFTQAQFAEFVAFHATLRKGYDYFYIDLPFGDGPRTVLARFVGGQFKRKQLHPHWIVTASLEVEEVPYMDEEILEALILIGDIDALEDVAELYHQAINDTLPSLN